MAKAKFYVTTPIYYVNDVPHVGHAYTTIIADVLARWNKLQGKKVFFLTGTDEHGSKVAKAAAEKNISPKEYTDSIAGKFKQAWKALNIEFDDFIRTTEKRHEQTVQKVWELLDKQGDIYLGKYEGLYCIGCEKYITEKELVEGKCPMHNAIPEKLVEKNYFLKLSKYKDKIIELIEKNEMQIIPKERKNEVLSLLKNEELKDVAISRPNVKWAIPVPHKPSQFIYVWIDALSNYISALGYARKNNNLFKEFWPADLHIMAKDILKFHAIIWPAMLLSLRLKVPRKLLIHGYFTVNGQKMSKSLGNVISPEFLAGKYGSDAVKYYLIREIPLGSDGDFSEENLVKRINNELANELGNLVNRSQTLLKKNFNLKVPKGKADKTLMQAIDFKKINSLIESLELGNALSEVFKFVGKCNQYINDKEPWKKKGKELEEIMYSVMDSIAVIAALLSAFTPETSQKILKAFKIKKPKLAFNQLKPGTQIEELPILFKKINA